MQTALDEVKRVTGMKAILLLSGPIPAEDGNIGMHLSHFVIFDDWALPRIAGM